MSGTGVVDAERFSVLTPTREGAAGALAQEKLKATSVGANGALGVRPRTKLCDWPAPMSIGAFGTPVSILVSGSVVWKTKLAGTLVCGAIMQAEPAAVPKLSMVANAVA